MMRLYFTNDQAVYRCVVYEDVIFEKDSSGVLTKQYSDSYYKLSLGNVNKIFVILKKYR